MADDVGVVQMIPLDKLNTDVNGKSNCGFEIAVRAGAVSADGNLYRAEVSGIKRAELSFTATIAVPLVGESVERPYHVAVAAPDKDMGETLYLRGVKPFVFAVDQ